MSRLVATAATLALLTGAPGPTGAPVAGPDIPAPVEAAGGPGRSLSPRPVTPVAATLRTRTATSVWDRLADCESGEWGADGAPIPGTARWDLEAGNGYSGGLQFVQASWAWAGGAGRPSEHPRDEQIRVAEQLLALQGVGAWPVCGPKVGLTRSGS